MGYWEYKPVADQYRVPIVVTGFEPTDILQGVLMTLRQLEEGRADVENAYARAVVHEGNISAQQLIDRVFMVCERKWRGIGNIPSSGWCLRPEYSKYDAELRFAVEQIASQESQVLRIRADPAGSHEADRLPGIWQPVHPGSAVRRYDGFPLRGACAAYYRYGDARTVAASMVGEV